MQQCSDLLSSNGIVIGVVLSVHICIVFLLDKNGL
jgi:hypothetical protein